MASLLWTVNNTRSQTVGWNLMIFAKPLRSYLKACSKHPSHSKHRSSPWGDRTIDPAPESYGISSEETDPSGSIIHAFRKFESPTQGPQHHSSLFSIPKLQPLYMCTHIHEPHFLLITSLPFVIVYCKQCVADGYTHKKIAVLDGGALSQADSEKWTHLFHTLLNSCFKVKWIKNDAS